MTKASSISHDFPEALGEQGHALWLKLVEKSIKDKAIGDVLFHASEDGFLVEADAPVKNYKTPKQKQAGTCPVAGVHLGGTIKAANSDILEDLAGGASALYLKLNLGAGKTGIKIRSESDFEALLKGVYLNYIPLTIDAGGDGDKALAMLLALYSAQNIAPNDAKAHVFGTPTNLKQVAQWPHIKTIAIDGVAFNAMGASPAQELAMMLAQGVQFLRDFEAHSIAPKLAQQQFIFHLSCGTEIFMEIAKFRALRVLWGAVAAGMGIDQNITLHAQTSPRMISNVDIETNILRTTAGAFAAMLGGADTIGILPFDHGAPDKKQHQKARRIARNIGLILEEEAALLRTHDVAAGSFAMEQLCGQICEAAWLIFQNIENQGGYNIAHNNGTIAKMLKNSATARQKAIEKGDKILIGVNAFKNGYEGGDVA